MKLDSFSVFFHSASLLFKKSAETLSLLSIDEGSSGASPPAGDAMVIWQREASTS